MVRPTGIRFNWQTADDNRFQRKPADETAMRGRAILEFEQFAQQLKDAGIEVVVVDPPSGVETPDAVFPNNWISFHADGTVIVYPMKAANRRLERRPEVIEHVRSRGFQVDTVRDFAAWEADGQFLEGTGSLVLDRVHRVAFASLSPRTDEAAVRRWCAIMNYSPICFHAAQVERHETIPIYHTNVMMGIGETWATVCLDSIPDAAERERVRDALGSAGRNSIAIDADQMGKFAGNVLQLAAPDGTPITVISETAWQSLSPAQRHGLTRGSRLLTAEIGAIETCGGGSVRCMLAEIFLTRADSAAGRTPTP